MREMKPLMLPKLVAQRKSSKSSLDMSADAAMSVYSNSDSGFYSASECSTPPTPSFHRGHLRFPSSTSSLSSSPPTHDPIEVPNASGKLPKLTEDVEREDDYVNVRSSVDIFAPEDHSISEAYDFATYGVQSKRRRSIEHGVQHRLERSFPSLSRKVRDRKRSSTFGRSSRSTTPSRQPSTRSSSMTSSIHQPPNYDITDKFPASLPMTACNSREQLNDSIVSLPIDVAKANALTLDVDEIDSERFATTPLLPPMLATSRHGDIPTQSPLQSPTVATTDAASPIDSPPARAYPTPPLSTKASIASFKRTGPLVPSTDIPPIMLADPTDKWALTLGHDNFTIYPEPYMPDVCDATTRNELFADWQQARGNFTKHQVRMAEHYGPTSKIYLLCEQKWAEIDAVWKKNHDLVKFLVPTEPSEPTSPVECVEPVPVSTIWPTLTDPKSEGKFPKLGDEDIVGPMVQAAPKVIQPITPRKRAFFKFLADLKFPGALLGRSSSSGLRGH